MPRNTAADSDRGKSNGIARLRFLEYTSDKGKYVNPKDCFSALTGFMIFICVTVIDKHSLRQSVDNLLQWFGVSSLHTQCPVNEMRLKVEWIAILIDKRHSDILNLLFIINIYTQELYKVIQLSVVDLHKTVKGCKAVPTCLAFVSPQWDRLSINWDSLVL